jgi:hypothetical protein
MIISYAQFKRLKIGTIIGLSNGLKLKPFVYGIKINDKEIVEVTPIYHNKRIETNFTGTIRQVETFILYKYKHLPNNLFKKRLVKME